MYVQGTGTVGAVGTVGTVGTVGAVGAVFIGTIVDTVGAGMQHCIVYIS